MKVAPNFQRFGERTLLVNWPHIIDNQIHNQVLRCVYWLKKNHSKLLVELVPTYSSLAIYLKSENDIAYLLNELKEVWPTNSEEIEKSNLFCYTIPVCYDLHFGLDIAELALKNQMSVQQVIALHTEPIYSVYFLGFLPGFPYLGGLDKRLQAERKTSPRSFVARGAVGIGGEQTGIYPVASPGGWNIIGKTPVSLFRPMLKEPSLLKAGDQVKFESIDVETFHLIEKEIESNTFQLKKTLIHD